jgi:hypothetical protein
MPAPVRSRLRILVVLILIAAFVTCIGWWARSGSDWEPAVTAFGLLVSLAAFYIDQWLTEAERRRELLAALVHELFVDLQVLNGLAQKPVPPRSADAMLPHLAVATTNAVISSGAFLSPRDSRLLQLLFNWRDLADSFNHRLDLADVHFVTTGNLDVVSGVSTSPHLSQIKVALEEISKHLLEHYPKESQITRDTILFPDASKAPPKARGS